MPAISPADERRNAWIYTINYIFIYFAAPVTYIGVVQATLFDKLGANATLANLPSSTYMLGQAASLFATWLVPHRHEKKALVWAYWATTAMIALVLITLILPVPSIVRIWAVVLQGLMQGVLGSITFVFMLQCLRRGTSEEGLARALKQTFTLTPIFAVLGSLVAQYILNPGLPSIPYPYDFALVYLIAVPCSAGTALISRRFVLGPLDDEPRYPLWAFLKSSLGSYASSSALVLLWLAYLLWYTSLGTTSNLALYTREAMGRDPKDFSGLAMAIRFGGKILGGFGLGWLAVRYGLKAGVIAAILLLVAGNAWPWVAPGMLYLGAFALLGAGELGGAYLPNYVGRLSSAADAPRNFAIITLATPASSFAPVLYGWLTDNYGFTSTCIVGALTAVAALVLVLQVRAKPRGE